MVEQRTENPRVVGSIPTGGTSLFAVQTNPHLVEQECAVGMSADHARHGLLRGGLYIYAGVAHLVERHLAKVEVAGSSPVARSKLKQSFLAIV